MIASTRVQTAADSTRARLCVLCAAGFLCPLTENVYDVEFLAFKIRDAETGKVRAPRPAGNAQQPQNSSRERQ